MCTKVQINNMCKDNNNNTLDKCLYIQSTNKGKQQRWTLTLYFSFPSLVAYITLITPYYGAVPKGLLTFLSTLYKKSRKLLPELWCIASRDKPPEKKFFLRKTLCPRLTM